MKHCYSFAIKRRMAVVVVVLGLVVLIGLVGCPAAAEPRRILLDTDVDTDDFFAILYLLKQNRSVIDLKAITISANAWTDAGHAVNQVYDLLYMMDRDDIAVGVGGDGGILDDGTILPNVGGFLPLIEQGISTAGNCRYRVAIPLGSGGRLDVNTNFGLRRGFLPQGPRKYSPLKQPTTQQVMIDMISAGPTTVLIIGSHTNLALFLMTNPHLKRNVEHIYVMGGGVRSKNPTGCCPKNASSSCEPQQCGDRGNLFTDYLSNPNAEFNIFGDPFAAYQVFHSGIPITLVPLDATNTIPISKEFYMALEQQQSTFEARYCFQSLKIIHDKWSDDHFYDSYFMWDSFTSGVAVATMRAALNNGDENEFAEMVYVNISVVTSNKPYGVRDGSNPFFDGHAIPKFNLQKDGIHSGHVQIGIGDPFCRVKGKKKGICEDGYTKEVNGPEGVRILVAQRAKQNRDIKSSLRREFFVSFLNDLNLPQQSGRFNFTTQFPYYRELLFRPAFTHRKFGKPVLFDMDMSAGDFLALIYLLKVPVEIIDLKGILVSGNGWANAATIDIIYDVLHMMGRDDIPVGLGSQTALGTPPLSCTYVKAIPHGSGGLIDSDTLFGLARSLPRSPRRYTAENSVEYGARRDTVHPELRQPLAFEVWQSISKSLDPNDKITILTNGPLTNLAKIILLDKNATSVIQDVFIVAGHITEVDDAKGNVFTISSNKYAEFNMFLDPLAAKTVMESDLKITLIPLRTQRQVTSFPTILKRLREVYRTPESVFACRLLSLLQNLRQKHQFYSHTDIFVGEILGAVFMVHHSLLSPKMQEQHISVLVGNVNIDGQIIIDKECGKLVNVLESLDTESYYRQFADLLGDKTQSAIISSFDEQQKLWSIPPNDTEVAQGHESFH